MVIILIWIILIIDYNYFLTLIIKIIITGINIFLLLNIVPSHWSKSDPLKEIIASEGQQLTAFCKDPIRDHVCPCKILQCLKTGTQDWNAVFWKNE